MRLGIDVDDVLFPWSKVAHDMCELAGITNGKVITQWAFQHDYGCTSEVLWAVLHDAYRLGMLLDTPPIEGAAEALAALRAAGHSIHIGTARGFEGELGSLVRRDTAEWFHRFGLEHDSLTFTKDKRVLAVDVFADDGPQNLSLLQDAGVYTYLVDSIHNQQAEHPRRVLSIIEFADAILGQEKAA